MKTQPAVAKEVTVTAATTRAAEVDVRYTTTSLPGYGPEVTIPAHVAMIVSLWEKGGHRRLYLDQAGRGGDRLGYWDVTTSRYVPTDRYAFFAPVAAAVAEAALAAIRAGRGPLAAFYQRIRPLVGHRKAVVATARKLLIAAWILLRDQRPAYETVPAKHRAKCRAVERVAAPYPTQECWRAVTAAAGPPDDPRCQRRSRA